MSTAPQSATDQASSRSFPLRCLDCGREFKCQPSCPYCGRPYPNLQGIISALGPLTSRNRIVADFYDGPGWARFRPWERLFLTVQGGARRTRMQILKHLKIKQTNHCRMLEVGIGDGENLRFLPRGWDVDGVDISRVQLQAALQRFPKQARRLAWAEAEALPFPDNAFDGCFTIGGFTYFRDHEAALLEMRRVTRPGCPIVVADEIPGLHRAGLGHLIGWKAFDAYWLRGLGLDRAFVSMVFDHSLDIDALCQQAWPGAVRNRIWCGLGYCLVGSPEGPPSRLDVRGDSHVDRE